MNAPLSSGGEVPTLGKKVYKAHLKISAQTAPNAQPRLYDFRVRGLNGVTQNENFILPPRIEAGKPPDASPFQISRTATRHDRDAVTSPPRHTAPCDPIKAIKTSY